MGVHTASSECQEKTRLLLEGLEGVQQIQDDVVVHGAGQQHDQRLKAVLERLQSTGLTLRKEKWFLKFCGLAMCSQDKVCRLTQRK